MSFSQKKMRMRLCLLRPTKVDVNIAYMEFWEATARLDQSSQLSSIPERRFVEGTPSHVQLPFTMFGMIMD